MNSKQNIFTQFENIFIQFENEIVRLNGEIIKQKDYIKKMFKKHLKMDILNVNNNNNNKINNYNFEPKMKDNLKKSYDNILQCKNFIIQLKENYEKSFYEYYHNIIKKILKITNIKDITNIGLNNNIIINISINGFKKHIQEHEEIIKLQLKKNIKECYKMKIRDNIRISKFIKAILLGYPIKYTETNIVVNSMEYVN
jgi:hypothetical protein